MGGKKQSSSEFDTVSEKRKENLGQRLKDGGVGGNLSYFRLE